MKKIVTLLSGGMDSSTLLYDCLSQNWNVWVLSVYYGQRHSQELNAAHAVAAAAKAKFGSLIQAHRTITFDHSMCQLLKGSSQTSMEVAVPHGHYTEESMKATVVPNRNMILLSLAAAWAVSLEANAVAYAAHAGDHAIYPDCRREFVTAMEGALQLANWSPVDLHAPFLDMTKAGITTRGQSLEVPFGLTYSCYEGEEWHCGACGTCVERREAFELSGVSDPTLYRN